MGNGFYGLLMLAMTTWVFAAGPTAVEGDLKAGMSLTTVVDRARDAGWQPEPLLHTLVDNGVDLVKGVQTISREWHQCDATYAVAGAAARMAPLRADEVAAAIANLRSCQCDAKSLWAKTRLNRRLRPEIQRVLVKVGDVCSCAAAGIEATVEAAPDQAENVIEAVINAKNPPDNTSDRFGEVGALPESGQWLSADDPSLRSRDVNLERLSDVCEGDYNERGDFELARQWRALPLDDIDSLGRHQARCDEPEMSGRDEQEEKRHSGSGLILSQYYEGQNHNQALELYNPTDKTIYLSEEPYSAEIYFHGYAVPGEVLNLKGEVPPRSTFVVVNALADNPRLKARADQLVFGLNFSGADAVVLKSRLDWNDCDCAVTSVAATMRAAHTQAVADNSHNSQSSVDADEFWLTRLKQHYALNDTPALVVDSAGELPVAPEQEKTSALAENPPLLHPGTWRRKSAVCFGDRVELDPFEPEYQWRVRPEALTDNLGRHQVRHCPETPQELLLSEMVIKDTNNQALEIFNGTSEPIDFSRDRYVLEIYRDDNLVPDERISLSRGRLPAGQAFVLVNADADEQWQAKADQKVKQLMLNNSYAVVLRKVVAPAYQSCYAEVASWLRKNPDPQYLSYIPILVVDPYIGPQSGDDPRDGDHGGDLASPN